MTDEELRTKLQKAVDRKLSGMKDDPWLAQRVMNRAEKEKPVMKKKLSLSIVLALMIVLSLGTALAAVLQPDFFSRVFGNEARQNVESHTETYDDDKGGTYQTVFPGREYVAVDNDAVERLIGDRTMTEPLTVTLNSHTLTILSAVRDENAMAMDMTLENPSGEKALVYDQVTNEAKGAFFAEDSDISFWIDMAPDMIYADLENSTDTCVRLYYYCVFREPLPDGVTPSLTVLRADGPYANTPDDQLQIDSVPIPASRAVTALTLTSASGQSMVLSPFSLKIAPAAEALASSADAPASLPDPSELGEIVIRYADGSAYTVLDRENSLDNTMYLCGGLGGSGLDTVMVLNRIVDTDQVREVTVNGEAFAPDGK